MSARDVITVVFRILGLVLAFRTVSAAVQKQHNSAFEATGLETELASVGATHLVLAGVATNWCIRATAYAALDRGYDLALVADAHTAETPQLDDGTRVEAVDVIRDLNTVTPWPSYPGRRSAVATSDEVFGSATA